MKSVGPAASPFLDPTPSTGSLPRAPLWPTPQAGVAPDRIQRSRSQPVSFIPFGSASFGIKTVEHVALALDARIHEHGAIDTVSHAGQHAGLVAMREAEAATISVVRDVGGRYPSLDLQAIEKGGIGQPHTLERHVGKSDAELRERLATERVPASSTYDSLASAQRSTDFVIGDSANQSRIGAWLERGARGTQLLDGTVPGAPVGRVMSRAEGAAGRSAQTTSDAQVVLKADPSSPSGYTVLSSYPTKP